MLTIFSAILGLIAGVIPAVIKYYETKQQFEYNLQVLRLQIDTRTTQTNINTISKSDYSLRNTNPGVPDSRFIEALRASVRPVLTYAFFLLFFIIKICVLVTYLQSGIPTREILALIWGSEEFSLFAAILSFWFSARTIDKYQQNKSGD